MAGDKKWILLNVGGTVFQTSRSTLIKSTPPNSPLHRISSNSTNTSWDRDQTGAYLIDRDPIYFAPVLNFLRHGRLVLDKNISEEGVLIEAEHFNLPELVKVIRQRLAENQLKNRLSIQQRDYINSLNLGQYEPFHGAMCSPEQSYQLTNYINEVLNLE